MVIFKSFVAICGLAYLAYFFTQIIKQKKELSSHDKLLAAYLVSLQAPTKPYRPIFW